jgi:hypothetical protein
MKERLISLDKLKSNSIVKELIIAFICWIGTQSVIIIHNMWTYKSSIKIAFINSFSYLDKDIKVKWILIFGLLILIIIIILLIVKKNRRYNPYKYIDYKEKVGNYKLTELHNILLTKEFAIQEDMQIHLGVKKMSLLKIFLLFISKFNNGIRFDDPGEEGFYLYYKLGPELMSYGLVKKIKQKARFSVDNEEEEVMISTDEAIKLYSFVEKVRLYTEIYTKEEMNK